MLIQRHRKQVVEVIEPVEKAPAVQEPKLEEELKTKRDVMQRLDEFGIEYDKKSTKSELLEVIKNAGQN